MRTKNSFRNIYVGVIAQLLIVIIGFVSRKIFIDILGIEMLGINGLLTSIVSMLGLTELGIGTAIIVNLYKPLADKDENKVIALIQFFRKIYRIIALIVSLLGIAFVPFLGLLIKENIDSLLLSIAFLLFLTDTVMTYLLAHKRALISADQKNYIISIVYTSFAVLGSLFQIIILVLTENFILFLSIRILIRLIENIVISKITDTKYPYIKTKEKLPIDKDTRDNIITNTKALAMHVIGRYLINGTDNIIISKFLGIIQVGLYSNYLLILLTVRTFIRQFSLGIIASFGNLLAKENEKKSLDIFKKANFLNFVLYNFSAISLLCLLNPFITLWIGKESLLSFPVIFILSLNFYLTGLSDMLSAIRSSAGIFKPDRYLHLLMAALNLIVSISLVNRIGIFGVFLGTLLCVLIKDVSILPSIVYKNIFKKSVKSYYKIFVVYLAATIISAGITLFICNYVIEGSGILLFIVRCLICVIIPNAVIIILFKRTQEFEFAWSYVKTRVGNQIRKYRR